MNPKILLRLPHSGIDAGCVVRMSTRDCEPCDKSILPMQAHTHTHTKTKAKTNVNKNLLLSTPLTSTFALPALSISL